MSLAVIEALQGLDVFQHEPKANCKWNTRKSVFQLPAALQGHIFQRNSYRACPLDEEEAWTFLTFFTGTKPGGRFDAKQNEAEGGAIWRKNTLVVNLGGGGGADKGLKDYIYRQMEAWGDAEECGELAEPYLTLYWLGTYFVEWWEEVIAQAKANGDVRSQRLHFNFYNYKRLPKFIGDVHLDVRLKAEVAEDLWRLILPLGNSHDRPLLFLVMNCEVVRGKLRFDNGDARIGGIARGGVLFDSVGGGALELVPAGRCDLGRGGDHANAKHIRFAHGALATGPPGERGIQDGRMVVTAVFTGHRGPAVE